MLWFFGEQSQLQELVEKLAGGCQSQNKGTADTQEWSSSRYADLLVGSRGERPNRAVGRWATLPVLKLTFKKANMKTCLCFVNLHMSQQVVWCEDLVILDYPALILWSCLGNSCLLH